MTDDAAREIKRRVARDDEDAVPPLYHIQPGYIDLNVMREPSALKGLAQEFTRELRRRFRPGGKIGHVLPVAVAHVARIARGEGAGRPRRDEAGRPVRLPDHLERRAQHRDLHPGSASPAFNAK